jgi:enterochelin esterase family protein
MPLSMKIQWCRPGVAMPGLIFAGALLMANAVWAQAPAKPTMAPSFSPFGPGDSVRSPEAQADGHVTFRVYAPEATKVLVQAGGTEATPGATMDDVINAMKGVPMVKGADGVWSVTLGPFQPGVYGYGFLIDGVLTTDPRNPLSCESLNRVLSIYEIPGAPFMEYKMDVPHGAIASVWYPSTTTGGLRRMHVYTPPGYTGKERLPVLYLLHGAEGTDEDWPIQGRAGAILDNLIAANAAVPMIVVMPAGHVNRNFQISLGPAALLHDSFGLDLVNSVIPYIDQHYATIDDREHRAIAGLSMGGLQTLSIALEHPELFDYVGIFSSGWFPEMRQDDGTAQKDLAVYKAYGKPYKLFWVDAGKHDIALDNSNASVELIRKYGIVPEVHLSEGFHAWNNWRDYLHTFAPRLFQPEAAANLK